jgi:proteic killer suppression protein
MLDMISGVSYGLLILIKSFADRETLQFWETGKSRKRLPPDLRKIAQRKLLMLDAAARLEDLKSPPGNRLHALLGERQGQFAIRINDQYRVCFRWDEGAHDVEITDYH